MIGENPWRLSGKQRSARLAAGLLRLSRGHAHFRYFQNKIEGNSQHSEKKEY